MVCFRYSSFFRLITVLFFYRNILLRLSPRNLENSLSSGDKPGSGLLSSWHSSSISCFSRSPSLIIFFMVLCFLVSDRIRIVFACSPLGSCNRILFSCSGIFVVVVCIAIVFLWFWGVCIVVVVYVCI